MSHNQIRIHLAYLLPFLLLIACSSNKFKANMSSDERFQLAKELLDKGDFLPAKTQFQILVLNYPGTQIADKSQFFLAESHFGLKEYILAAAEYEKMIRNYRQSELVDDAQYKVGMCYYELSPGFALDQQYTMQAIVEFQRFLEEYPGSELRPEVERRYAESRNKMAKKEFRNAILYRKMGYCYSAVIYFNEFLKNYYDTEYAEEAHYRKGECLIKLKNWEEAKEVLQEFLEKYPSSRFAKTALEQVDLAKKEHATNGK